MSEAGAGAPLLTQGPPMRPLRSVPHLATLALLCAPAAAQWASDTTLNTPVCVRPGDQTVNKAAATGDGGTWIGWFDHRGSNYDVYVQLLDRDGNALLAPDGLLVSDHPQDTSLVDWDLISDSSGNCVLTFTDLRAGGDLDVQAYRISPSGQFLWGPDGVTLSSNGDFEVNPVAAELSDGSFVFVWARLPSGTGSIRAQVLDDAGTPRFAAGDIALATGTTSGELPAFAEVVASDHGSFIVEWVRSIATFMSPRHLRTQKYDGNGNARWNGGSPVVVYDALSVPIAYQPVLQSDGAGGAVYAWHSSPVSLFDSFVQRVDATGAEVFAHNGVQVSTEAGTSKLDPALAWLPASGDMIVLFDRRDGGQNNRGVGVQRVSAGGALLWGASGVELEAIDSVTEGYERIVPFGDGALLSYFSFPVFGGQDCDIVVRRLDGTGADVWAPARVTASSAASPKGRPVLVMDAVGTARIVWQDQRNDLGDVYAQDVHYDGTPGPITTCTASTYCTSLPNSAGPGAHIGWAGSTSLALDNLTLTATGCPPSVNGLFFYGANATGGTPLGNGLLCTSGSAYRLAPLTTSSVGDASYAVDLLDPWNPAGPILAGSTWHFQLWYRDPAGGGSQSNLTDALRAGFCQ